MIKNKKLTINSKMNVYYCSGMDKPKIIANSIKDLFNSKNARDYLPIDNEEFKELKNNIYYFMRKNDIVDVDYVLSSDYNIFICKNSLIGQLIKLWGFSEERAKKSFTNFINDKANNKLVWQNIVDFYYDY